MKVIDSINATLEEISAWYHESEYEKELKTLNDALIKIQKFLEEKCGIHEELDDFSQANRVQDYAVVGKLIALSCDHNECFSYAERLLYSKHLQVFIDNI